MSQPIRVDILSDSDSDSEPCGYRRSLRDEAIDLTTPPPFPQSKKKQKTHNFSNPSNSTVFIIDDDHTPFKSNRQSSPTPSPFSDASLVKCSRGTSSFSEGLATEQLVVAETPISELLKSEVAISKCNTRISTAEDARPFITNHNSGEIKGWICVESDDESEDLGEIGALKDNPSTFAAKLADETEFPPRLVESSSFSCATSFQLQRKATQNPVRTHILEGCSTPGTSEDGISEVNNTCFLKEKKKRDETVKLKRTAKEERHRLMEEKKRLKEQEKLLKAASKAEAAEMKKREKELQKWEKGKYALKSIVAEIDKKVVELGSIGGHLLTRFAEKGLSYRITSNPVERTIVWNMAVPDEISQIAPERIMISYILVVYEAEEFCNLVVNESLMDHIQSVQHRYPHHTICYVTNKLMAYINKREQAQYKNPANNCGWKRPVVEEVFAKFATHFSKVHSRQCVDEAELAEHVVGLTCSLANCQFRKRLTRFSVNANGSAIPKDCVDKNLIKKNLWLKALVAIPKVQPRFAMAIWKKYPTMKSLLRVYMNPTKSVHEKEFLLKDLTTEGLLGDDRRLGEVCSKRIYRILMAQCGNIKTDDVENGADFFNL
ncbi:crossover junction endonuclease EME1B-like isoform X2 [Salvia miltiorrhiza]|uniref:crossover junction endonuclease EME1B-like isoform X2 n=1 Tax=Salvia miltiorrhiza TaxID=226208 RepID=UPI0025AB6118|nr:crossover junction endonuclease EME1B-like isoform X2 [Salvia miltiorrhiza]